MCMKNLSSNMILCKIFQKNFFIINFTIEKCKTFFEFLLLLNYFFKIIIYVIVKFFIPIILLSNHFQVTVPMIVSRRM